MDRRPVRYRNETQLPRGEFRQKFDGQGIGVFQNWSQIIMEALYFKGDGTQQSKVLQPDMRYYLSMNRRYGIILKDNVQVFRAYPMRFSLVRIFDRKFFLNQWDVTEYLTWHPSLQLYKDDKVDLTKLIFFVQPLPTNPQN